MNLYVGSLPSNVNENDLRGAFEPFGPVREVRLITEKSSGQSVGYGFVEMPSQDDAEKAMDEMNGKEFMGSTIIVNPAKPKVSRHAGGQNRKSTGRGRRY